MMLDEAISALDNITQKIVSDSLEQLKCTRIVVAHRLSTIRHCDRIIVLDQCRKTGSRHNQHTHYLKQALRKKNHRLLQKR